MGPAEYNLAVGVKIINVSAQKDSPTAEDPRYHLVFSDCGSRACVYRSTVRHSVGETQLKVSTLPLLDPKQLSINVSSCLPARQSLQLKCFLHGVSTRRDSDSGSAVAREAVRT